MKKKHLLGAFVSLVAMSMAFVLGCALVGVPTAQQTPILTTVFGFLTVLATQIWAKADTDAQLTKIERKADAAADAAAAVEKAAVETASRLAGGNGKGG